MAMLRQIVLILTMRCDLKCLHCLRDYPKERQDLPTELMPSLLVSAQQFGASSVALTGGEPHLHPQFEEIVEQIVNAGYTWHFVSNGMQIKPYLPVIERFCDQLKHVTLSMDGATSEIHDLVRNRTGVFEKLLSAAKIYKSQGCRLFFSTSLNQYNQHQLRPMVELAKDLGADGMGVGGTIPTEWNQEIALSDAESLHLWKEINQLKEELDFNVSAHSSLFTRGGVNFCGDLNLREVTVNSQGNMIFCCDNHHQGAVIGSLHKETFPSLIKKWMCVSHELQILRLEKIAKGKMGEGFDTCAFCNQNLYSLNT